MIQRPVLDSDRPIFYFYVTAFTTFKGQSWFFDSTVQVSLLVRTCPSAWRLAADCQNSFAHADN